MRSGRFFNTGFIFFNLIYAKRKGASVDNQISFFVTPDEFIRLPE